MQEMDQILGSSGMDVASLGARFGLTPEQTRAAMGSLMPAVAGGFQKRAEAGDVESVAATANLGELDPATGNQVLGQIFGSKDVSRQVASHAAGQTGVSNTILKAMLPIVAFMVAQHLARNMGGGGAATGGGAGGLGGGLGGILGSILGGGSGGGTPGRSANPLDDILGGFGGLGRR